MAEPFFWEGAALGVAERVQEALRLLEAAGAKTRDLALPGSAEVYESYLSGGIVSTELYAFLSRDLPAWIETLDPRVRKRMEAGSALLAWEYFQRRDRYAALAQGAVAALEGVDTLVCPTVPISPPPIAEVTDDTYVGINLRMLRNTCAVNFLGLCAVTLPVGCDQVGMPVGLQLIGRPGTEARLPAIARAIERLLKKKDVWDSPAI